MPISIRNFLVSAIYTAARMTLSFVAVSLVYRFALFAHGTPRALPKVIRATVYFKIVFLSFLSAQSAFAQDLSSEGNLQVPLTDDGISTRLVPEKNETITFPRTVFTFGAYRELLINESDNNYAPTGLGVILGFEQNIRGMWSGGVEARWSDWNPRLSANNTSSNTNVSPLSLFSKVTAAPKLDRFVGNTFGTLFRPYATGGLGYTAFFNERSWTSSRSQTAFGQVSVTYGGGIRWVLNKSAGVKMGYEMWRGVESTAYTAQIFFVQLVFGDIYNL